MGVFVKGSQSAASKRSNFTDQVNYLKMLNAPIRLYNSIINKLLSTSNNFVNVNKALKLFITIPATSCSCERAFSKLSLVKKKLRSHICCEKD